MSGRGRLLSGLGFLPPKGFVSWRNTERGSWYIETLDSILEHWASSEDLQYLLLRVRGAFLPGVVVGLLGPVWPLQNRQRVTCKTSW